MEPAPPGQVRKVAEGSLPGRFRQPVPVFPPQPLDVAQPHADRELGGFSSSALNFGQAAVPVAVENADRTHLDSMNAGIVDDGGSRVEPHRLGIQQGADKLGRVVAFEVGGGIGDMGKAGGMALGEAVFAESADLLEDTLGKFRLNPLGHHAGDQPLPVPLDPP